ncbi:MAG: ZIP family metal transporter [Pseudomonadales bacterium]|nr:ZIP family metal transporter [Pseudomonadales bacterium]
MSVLAWIIVCGLLMAVVAFVGAFTLLLKDATLKAVLLPLVAFAAGTLIGSAFIFMIPTGLESYGDGRNFYLWVLIGFTTFFGIEQLLHWHHSHRPGADREQPVTWLILIGDGIHNFVGGVAVAGTFLVDVQLGIMVILAALAHEIPQELGYFAVLIHGGWSKSKALLFNFLSALGFLGGGLVAYVASSGIDVSFLLPFAAGTFIYIGAADLVPEVNKHESLSASIVNVVAFSAGIMLLWSVARLLPHHG